MSKEKNRSESGLVRHQDSQQQALPDKKFFALKNLAETIENRFISVDFSCFLTSRSPSQQKTNLVLNVRISPLSNFFGEHNPDDNRPKTYFAGIKIEIGKNGRRIQEPPTPFEGATIIFNKYGKISSCFIQKGPYNKYGYIFDNKARVLADQVVSAILIASAEQTADTQKDIDSTAKKISDKMDTVLPEE